MSDDDHKDPHWLGRSDTGTSPLVMMAMSAAKVTLYFLAGLVVLVLGVFLWQKSKDNWIMANGDLGMIAVLGILVFLCAFMGRKIAQLLKDVR